MTPGDAAVSGRGHAVVISASIAGLLAARAERRLFTNHGVRKLRRSAHHLSFQPRKGLQSSGQSGGQTGAGQDAILSLTPIPPACLVQCPAIIAN